MCLRVISIKYLKIYCCQMSEIGQTSQSRVEEIPVLREDIPVPGEEEARIVHVVNEQLVTVVTSGQEVETVQEEEEDEEDPEELFYGQIYDEIVGLREQISVLEEMSETRRITIEEKVEEIYDLNERLGNVERELVHSEGQTEQLLEENEKIKTENGELKIAIEELKVALKEETAKRVRAEDAHMRVSQRSDRAEGEVRAKKFKIDAMEYIFHTSMDRAQDRVYHYPIQLENHPWFVDRRTMVRIMEQERDEAVRRGLSS